MVRTSAMYCYMDSHPSTTSDPAPVQTEAAGRCTVSRVQGEGDDMEEPIPLRPHFLLVYPHNFECEVYFC